MYVLQEFLKERLRTYYRATYVLASISGVRFYLGCAADPKQGESLFSSTTSWAPGKNIQNH